MSNSMRYTIEWVVALLWVIILMTGLTMVVIGCQSMQGNQDNQNQPPSTPGSLPDVVTKVIYKTNWLTTVAIVGIALSAAAFVQGAKFALPMFAGCATLLATILTISAYAKWIALGGFGVFIVIFAWTIWQKRKNDQALNSAFKEVVTGAQNLKEKILDGIKNDVTDQWSVKKKEINGVLAEPQSPTTQELVNKVKADLGLKTGTK